MSTASRATTPQRVLLRNVPSDTYARLRDAPENDQVRMTYDRGTLEIMSPLSIHEWLRRLLAKLLDVATMELRIAIRSGGSTTYRREDLERGLEPDECYYVLSEPRVRGKDLLDLSTDPPPDLAIEIDVTRSSYNKLPIYAALGVTELWRYVGDEFHVYWLDSSGAYQPAERSLNLPSLPLAELKRFLDMRGSFDETTLALMFREWVRENLVA